MDKTTQSALMQNYQRSYKYYLGEVKPIDLGIAIPPHLRHFKPSIGWAKIGVEKFADRVIPASLDTAGIVNLRSVINEAVKTSVVFGIAYLVVYQDGLTCRARVGNPFCSFADLNPLTRDVISYWETSDKEEVNLYAADGIAVIYPFEQTFGMQVFPIVHNQDCLNPYGQSRITKPVRNLIDSAIRTLARSEIAAEFYSFPQSALLGADMSMFEEHSELEGTVKNFAAGIGRLLLFPPNEKTGQSPTLQQLQQQSFAPHTDQLNQLARMCAAELNIDVAELGIYQTNPASAEALYVSKEDLVLEVKEYEANNSTSIMRAINALIEGNKLDTEAKLIWTEPATPSIASQADAFIKLVQAIPALAVSPAGLRLSGLSEDAIQEVSGELFD